MNWALSSQLPVVRSAAGETSCSHAPAHVTAGHRTQDTGHRTQDTGHRTQDTGHRTQDTGHRTQDTGHRTQDTGHRTQDTGLRTQNTKEKYMHKLAASVATVYMHTCLCKQYRQGAGDVINL